MNNGEKRFGQLKIREVKNDIQAVAEKPRKIAGEDMWMWMWMCWPANHPLSQSVDWIAKDAVQRSRTEGAVLPARRLAPEHDPYMTSEHSTTARWIRLGVDFEEGGNRSARGKPSKSGWDRLKLSPHTFVVEVEGVIDVHYASLTYQAVQHGVFYLDGHPSRYQPRPTGLNFGEQTGTGVPRGHVMESLPSASLQMLKSQSKN